MNDNASAVGCCSCCSESDNTLKRPDGNPEQHARGFGRIDENNIRLLVDQFYRKVRLDPDLGPIFERVIGDDWDEHLAKMRDFWSSVMLTSGKYKGNPVVAHLRLKDVRPALFDRWLALFGETSDELYQQSPGDALRTKAARIAESLKIAMFYRPEIRDRGSL
jgi:hemoglobin